MLWCGLAVHVTPLPPLPQWAQAVGCNRWSLLLLSSEHFDALFSHNPGPKKEMGKASERDVCLGKWGWSDGLAPD